MSAKIIIDGTLDRCPFYYKSCADGEDAHRCVIFDKNTRCDYMNGYNCPHIIPLTEALENLKVKEV